MINYTTDHKEIYPKSLCNGRYELHYFYATTEQQIDSVESITALEYNPMFPFYIFDIETNEWIGRYLTEARAVAAVTK